MKRDEVEARQKIHSADIRMSEMGEAAKKLKMNEEEINFCKFVYSRKFLGDSDEQIKDCIRDVKDGKYDNIATEKTKEILSKYSGDDSFEKGMKLYSDCLEKLEEIKSDKTPYIM